MQLLKRILLAIYVKISLRFFTLHFDNNSLHKEKNKLCRVYLNINNFYYFFYKLKIIKSVQGCNNVSHFRFLKSQVLDLINKVFSVFLMMINELFVDLTFSTFK